MQGGSGGLGRRSSNLLHGSRSSSLLLLYTAPCSSVCTMSMSSVTAGAAVHTVEVLGGAGGPFNHL
eukprot:1143098-Pelagomonas_calceolata.AAC.3